MGIDLGKKKEKFGRDRVQRGVETKMFLSIFAKIRNFVYFDEISLNFVIAKIVKSFQFSQAFRENFRKKA